tara:strand:+ start:1084 stop:1356 length:273 start_codon:yes stop_codon:yes gene_type:complete
VTNISNVLVAKLPGLRLHDVRHTFASTALEHETLDQIGRVLGHQNPQTTRRYAHLSDAASGAVAEKVGNAIASAIGDISKGNSIMQRFSV